MQESARRNFPSIVVLEGGVVVDADPLLPTAAAFTDAMPSGERVSASELADGIGVPIARAEAILVQLEALGHAGRLAEDGERAIFDPDGPTDPTPLDLP